MVDEREEGVMSVVSVRAETKPGAVASVASFETVSVTEPEGLALGVTTLAHLATSLRVARDYAFVAPAHVKAFALPAATPASESTFPRARSPPECSNLRLRSRSSSHLLLRSCGSPRAYPPSCRTPCARTS